MESEYQQNACKSTQWNVLVAFRYSPCVVQYGPEITSKPPLPKKRKRIWSLLLARNAKPHNSLLFVLSVTSCHLSIPNWLAITALCHLCRHSENQRTSLMFSTILTCILVECNGYQAGRRCTHKMLAIHLKTKFSVANDLIHIHNNKPRVDAPMFS